MKTDLAIYRQEDIGKSFLYNPKFQQKIEFTIQERVLQAAYLSIQALQDLENPAYSYPIGRVTNIAIGSWFICIETIINNVLKIISLENKTINFDILKTKALSTRLETVIENLQIEREEFGRMNLYAQINEFCNFRNEIFHDRSFTDELVFHHTKFCGSVTDANQVDLIQAFQIFIKVAEVLRYSISGVDLMPNIQITTKNTVFFIKLNEFYKRFVVHGFGLVLEKHSLDIGFPLEIELKNSPWVNKPISPGWGLMVKMQPLLNPVQLNLSKTKFLDEAHDKLAKEYESKIQQGHFLIADYVDRRAHSQQVVP